MKDFSIRSKKGKKWGDCQCLGGALRYFILSGWHYFLWNPNFLDQYEDFTCYYMMSCCFAWKKGGFCEKLLLYLFLYTVSNIFSSPKTPRINRGSKFSWVLQQREDEDSILGGKVHVPKPE